MTGDDAKGYADAFDALIATLFKIVSSPGGMLVILILALAGLGVWVYRLRGVLERQLDAKCAELKTRLQECENRHIACEQRDRINVLAIAMLHDIAKSLQACTSGNSVSIPSLQDIFSGRWAVAKQFNDEISSMPGHDGPG
jgi:hypothetical protein